MKKEMHGYEALERDPSAVGVLFHKCLRGSEINFHFVEQSTEEASDLLVTSYFVSQDQRLCPGYSGGLSKSTIATSKGIPFLECLL